jgi:ABC-type bacteriocin/lantibiotic exporter with double-glycine peptidase domain
VTIKTIDYPLKDFLKNGVVSLSNALLMMLCVYILKGMMAITIWNFFLLILVGILTYGLLTYLTDRLFKQKMIPLLKESMFLLIK